jgi:hypothetical protein
MSYDIPTMLRVLRADLADATDFAERVRLKSQISRPERALSFGRQQDGAA